MCGGFGEVGKSIFLFVLLIYWGVILSRLDCKRHEGNSRRSVHQLERGRGSFLIGRDIGGC